ncbi:MAG: hypothetical protein JXO49_00675 [Deltaproteobacteria bacterium]|nr:hypothetical protein [Candidatus Anaeroferrophillus wilburensis]MBN2887839.1 hypothetical protein [Deltaproteobacteria bacterium]
MLSRKQIRCPFQDLLCLGGLLCIMVWSLCQDNRLWAAVAGPCSDCHTMHYSQGGDLLAAWGSSGPYAGLLANDCVGCHTGTNSSGGNTPCVTAATAPDYGTTGTEGTTLAGGSFYWVTGDDTCGHNVSGIAGIGFDQLPPGFTNGRAAGDSTTPGGGAWLGSQQVTCAGTYGCHGSHNQDNQTAAIRGGHHSTKSGAITPDNDATDYRMLVGIAGYEDPDWEFLPDTSSHNQYKGVHDPNNSTAPDTSTISYFCSECHGSFHDDISTGITSPWLRHPTNYDMGIAGAAGGEYRYFNSGTGSAVSAYSVIAPVASSVTTTPLSVVSAHEANNTAIVTCISCHRAHGSQFYKSMRWDYAGSPTGGFCSLCHTSKD